jgi:hypothetical protein
MYPQGDEWVRALRFEWRTSLLPLRPRNLEELVQNGAADFSKITEKEIQDKSKGDTIKRIGGRSNRMVHNTMY